MAGQKQPINLNAETTAKPMDRDDDDLKTMITNLTGRLKFHPTDDAENLSWANEMVKMVSYMQLMMKEKGMDNFRDYSDLDLYDEDPLPKKFKFPNIKKYVSTKNPYLHLK